MFRYREGKGCRDQQFGTDIFKGGGGGGGGVLNGIFQKVFVFH